MIAGTLLNSESRQQGRGIDLRRIASCLIAASLVGCGVTTTTSTPPTVATVETTAAAAPPEVTDSLRQEIDQYAFAMFHLQRVNVLQDRGVQRDLTLTAIQIENFSALKREVEALSGELSTLSPDEMKTRLKSDLLPKAEAYRDLLDRELSAQQQQTLRREVLKRQRGAITLLLGGVPEELTLTQEQKDAIYRTVDETRRMVDWNNLKNPLEIARLMSRGAAARKAAEERLTPEQRELWQTLLNEE